MSLSLFEFAGALEIFTGKVLLLALAVFLLTGLMKLAVPEKARKYVTVLPFIVGIILYGGYDFIFEGINPISPHTVSAGIQCGVAATIYYVIYSQFFKNSLGGDSDLLTVLIAGIVRQDVVKNTVKSILDAFSEGEENLPKKLYDILKDNKSEDVTAEEIMLAVKNITGKLKGTEKS